ncbi:MAG: hypothetical protein ABIG89_03640 [Candidatus Woesearchaeota archaeon]
MIGHRDDNEMRGWRKLAILATVLSSIVVTSKTVADCNAAYILSPPIQPDYGSHVINADHVESGYVPPENKKDGGLYQDERSVLGSVARTAGYVLKIVYDISAHGGSSSSKQRLDSSDRLDSNGLETMLRPDGVQMHTPSTKTLGVYDVQSI